MDMATVEDHVETWVWPPDVLQLAKEKGVSQYLEPMLEMTREHFANAGRISVSVDVDWEIENLRTILFSAEVVGLSPEKYAETSDEYVRKSFDIVPSELICEFGLRLTSPEI